MATVLCDLQNGAYSNEAYFSAYEAEFIKLNPKAGCLADFVVFYQLAMLPGLLEREVENAMLDYVLSHARGIVYIYNSPVNWRWWITIRSSGLM